MTGGRMQDIHVFDFDGSVVSQTTLMKRYGARIKTTNLARFKQVARLWSSPENFERIKNEMAIKPGFSFIGSGDYHHFSLALIQQIKTPITVVLFDNHPDWMKPPHLYHCGTWVYSLARLAQVKRVIIIGLESGDIEDDQFNQGDTESYANGKIVLLPYRPVEINEPGAPGKSLNSRLAVDLHEGIEEILRVIPTEDVYISLDKDCLRKEDAFTNWEQGSLPLATVLACIKSIHQKFNVIGADTVGDYSPPRFISPLKWIGSLLDRPGNAFKLINKPRLAARNEFANLALLELFFPHV
jgi:arginase family enzyme